MAVTSLGAATTNVAGTTVVLTVTADVAVGDKIIVGIAGGVVSAPTVSVTDSGGNSYTVHQQNNGTWLCGIASAECTTALTSGVSTITVTWSTTNTAKCMGAAKVDNLIDTNAYDVGTTATGTTTGWNTGTTAATAQADELLFAVCANDSAGAETNTAGTNWTEIHDATNGNAFQICTQYRVVSSTGTYSGDGTWTNSGSRSWRAMIGTFKMSGSAPPQQVRPDADLAATGWTPTPLFSKVNESSADGTVISATAS